MVDEDLAVIVSDHCFEKRAKRYDISPLYLTEKALSYILSLFFGFTLFETCRDLILETAIAKQCCANKIRSSIGLPCLK